MSLSLPVVLLIGLVVCILLLCCVICVQAGRREDQRPKRTAPPHSPESMVQPLLDTLQLVALRSGDSYLRERAESALRDWDVRSESLSGPNGVKL